MEHSWVLVVLLLHVALPGALCQSKLEVCRERFVSEGEVGLSESQYDGKFSQKDVIQEPVSLTASVNNFSFKLLRNLQLNGGEVDDKKNIIIAPLSIYLVFSYLYDSAVAGSETRSEIAATLGYESDECYGLLVREAFKGLGGGTVNGNELALASKVFLNDAAIIKEGVLNSGEIELIDFSDGASAASTINDFVSRTTKGQITEVVTPTSVDPATVMTVINAIFFKGQWAHKFDEAATKKRTFTRMDGTTKEVLFMEQEAEFSLSRSSDPAGSFLEMPYVGDRFAMHIFLPRDANATTAFLTGVKFNFWRDIQLRTRLVDVVVRIPKFEIEGSHNLHEILPTLSPAMKRIFTPQAELDIVSEGAYVDSAVHKAKITINEEGTVAAASTLATVQPLSAPPTFYADRPFVYFITDKENGNLIVFMGTVMDP